MLFHKVLRKVFQLRTVAIACILGAEVYLLNDKISCTNRTWLQKPIRNFHFLALHKTASTVVRDGLSQFCTINNLTCLEYNVCLINDCRYEDDFVEKVDIGSMTPSRIRKCCPEVIFVRICAAYVK